MTFLGLSLFYQNPAPIGRNAAPTIPVATLNFDFKTNSAPTGVSRTLTFEVTAS